MQPDILFPHISINVSDLTASLTFYSAFFGVEPVKLREGYAKFELQNPKLNFTLNEKPGITPTENVLNHLGFQVASTDDVLLARLRLKKAGLATEDEMSTTCCYAVQDKTWVKDPNGISWEVFTVLSDADSYRGATSTGSACCTPAVVLLDVVPV